MATPSRSKATHPGLGPEGQSFGNDLLIFQQTLLRMLNSCIDPSALSSPRYGFLEQRTSTVEDGADSSKALHAFARRAIEAWGLDASAFLTSTDPQTRASTFPLMVHAATGGSARDFALEGIPPSAFDFLALVVFATAWGFTVTSSFDKLHGEMSFHPDGWAVDLRTRGQLDVTIQKMRQQAAGLGIRTIDERSPEARANLKHAEGANFHLDTGTNDEVRRRRAWRDAGGTRISYGLSPFWPPPNPTYGSDGTRLRQE